jgi:hypothetical protein
MGKEKIGRRVGGAVWLPSPGSVWLPCSHFPVILVSLLPFPVIKDTVGFCSASHLQEAHFSLSLSFLPLSVWVLKIVPIREVCPSFLVFHSSSFKFCWFYLL